MNRYLLVLLTIYISAPVFAQNGPGRINLVVVQGEGEITGLRQRASHHPIVRVEDQDNRPVAGAAVVFALPLAGPTGEFVNGAKTLSLVTDQEGLAAAPGLRANDMPGKLEIYVTATYRGLRARSLITQMIQPAPGSGQRRPEF